MPSPAYSVLWNSPWPLECAVPPPALPDWARYNISTNAKAAFNGATIATLYEDTGLFPTFTGMGPGGACADGDWNCTKATALNGGLPQLVNMSAHLAKVADDIERWLPDPHWSGVANIDYEAWAPDWESNKYLEYWIYVNRSEELVRQRTVTAAARQGSPPTPFLHTTHSPIAPRHQPS